LIWKVRFIMSGTPKQNRSLRFKNELDFEISPFTGMKRQHWLEAAHFLIDGVFSNIGNINDPIDLPKQNKISYPQSTDPSHRFQAAEFEGLARTFMAACPLIMEDTSIESNGINLRDYYSGMILKAADPKSPRFLGRISDFIKKHGRSHYQHTVEGGGLVISLMNCREQIWNQYKQSEKQMVADLISDYAHNLTIAANWRLFNILMLTFLKVNGFKIDEAVLKDHLQHILSCYAGNGWYVDDENFDFYNAWGFHFYGPIWCNWYGYDNEPEIAKIIEERNHEFIETWPRFFARDGKQLMWGRSVIYRFAASTAFGAHFLLQNTVFDPGFGRRISSANMMQFLNRDDIYVNGLPCLGYYGPFEPLIQFYSCAASPFWIAKLFVALTLPKDSPFWTVKENEGFWSELGDHTETLELPGPGIQIANHGKIGTTEIRTSKVSIHDTYYNQLQFNPHFLLETESKDGTNAANYSVRELSIGNERTPLIGVGLDFRIPVNIAFNKIEDGILYRQLNIPPVGLGDPAKGGRINRGPERIDLADIIIPNGVIRVDRIRVPYRNALQLGHFALPHLNGKAPEISHYEVDGNQAIAAKIEGRQILMIAIYGWDKLSFIRHTNLNPEAKESTVIYAERIREKDYCGMEIMITVMLHRLDNGHWVRDDLIPIRSFKIIPFAPSGNACGVKLKLRNEREYLIDYGNADGRRII